jgi:hypothetical protein
MGANRQYIRVLPALDMVIPTKWDFDEEGERDVQPQEFDAIRQMVIASASKTTPARALDNPPDATQNLTRSTCLGWDAHRRQNKWAWDVF